MNANCRTFRSLWLERAHTRPGSEGAGVGRLAHRDECAACRVWVSRAEARIRALAGLPRRSAPASLEERLFPADHGLEVPARVRLLESLPRHGAPAVLERLLEEELAAPAAARARRFAGDLERPEAPEELEQRLTGRPAAETRPRLRGASRRGPVRLLAPLASLAAAALLAVVLLGRGDDDRPRLVVHHAESASELDSLALSYLDGKLGGLLLATSAPEDRR